MLWFLIFLVIANAQSFDEKSEASMKSVKCSINETFVFKNFSCFAKSYSRNVSTMNVKVYFKEPLNQVFVKFERNLARKVLNLYFFQLTGNVYFKYGTIYREVLHSKKKDWCKSPQGDTSSDPEFRQIVKFFKIGAPETVHECPYNGFFMQNFTFKEKAMEAIFPTGDYKLQFRFWDINDALIFNFTLVTQLKSPNRDTFG